MTIESAPKTRTIRLQSGRDLVLCELSLFDLSDGEDVLKMPVEEWIHVDEQNPEKTKVRPKVLGTIVWLMARKAGMTIADITSRKWPFSLDALQAELTMADVQQHAESIVKCFYGIA